MRKITLFSGEVALVDEEDYERIAAFRWHRHSRGYAVRSYIDEEGKHHTIAMHREVMQVVDETYVDHKNFDALDNRKDNLRLASPSQNSMNRRIMSTNKSGYKGVSRSKGRCKWNALIYKNRKSYRLGSFETAEEAALAYNEAAIRLHGEFAVLNEIPTKTEE